MRFTNKTLTCSNLNFEHRNPLHLQLYSCKDDKDLTVISQPPENCGESYEPIIESEGSENKDILIRKVDGYGNTILNTDF